MDYMLLLIALLGGHALADYPLQGDFLSKAKSRYSPLPGIPWYQAMAAHVTIHGMFVSLLTGVWYLGVLEAIIHWWTDDRKCAGKISYNTDQAIHVGCKLLWWIITIVVTSSGYV